VHIDIKHLPKLQTANGESRKHYLYVAVDRCSRWVHLAVLYGRWLRGSLP
jgi:hypothetical protein